MWNRVRDAEELINDPNDVRGIKLDVEIIDLDFRLHLVRSLEFSYPLV